NSEFQMRLRDEFARRVRVNERYSIRSFAAHLGLDSSTLSQILAGKRNLSEDKIKAIYLKVGYKVQSKSKTAVEFNQLDIDTFAVISDWYNFAILDLAQLKSFKPNAKWIARKLNIQPLEAVSALERLQRLGMLVIKNGKLTK